MKTFPHSPIHPVRRPSIGRAAATAALAVAAVAASVPALAMPGRHEGGMHGAAPHHGGAGMSSMMARPEHVERMLEGVGASAEQRTQVRQILRAAHQELAAGRDAGRALREQGRQIFTAPTVDARAAEAWRQQVQARRDEASKRMLQAMIDVSRVLTPEQRARIAERMGSPRARMERRPAAEPAKP